MQVKTINLARNDAGQNLLTVTFDDEGIEREWMPRWDDLCAIARAAAVTEYANVKGSRNEQLEQLDKTAWFVHEVCGWAIL